MIIKVRLKYIYTKLYGQGRNKEVGDENRARKNGIEEKIKRELNNELLKKCLTEIKKEKQNRTRWETDRKMYFRRNGMSEIEVKRMWKEGNNTIGSFIEREI